jgi:hypothetical protein
MARTKGPCALYPTSHRPAVPASLTEGHHPWPKYLGGPERQELVDLCGSCHNAVHLALTAMVEGLSLPDGVTPRQVRLARRGYDAWVTANQPVTDRAEHAAWVAKLAA